MKLTRAEMKAAGIPVPKKRRGLPWDTPGEPQTVAYCGKQVFDAMCKANGLPVPIAEYKFSLPRQWRFDYCWPEIEFALEVEGGIWTDGRHSRGKGFLGDIEKYNEAALRGWRVFRCTPEQVESGEVFALLKRAFEECE